MPGKEDLIARCDPRSQAHKRVKVSIFWRQDNLFKVSCLAKTGRSYEKQSCFQDCKGAELRLRVPPYEFLRQTTAKRLRPPYLAAKVSSTDLAPPNPQFFCNFLLPLSLISNTPLRGDGVSMYRRWISLCLVLIVIAITGCGRSTMTEEEALQQQETQIAEDSDDNADDGGGDGM